MEIMVRIGIHFKMDSYKVHHTPIDGSVQIERDKDAQFINEPVSNCTVPEVQGIGLCSVPLALID